MNYAEVILRLLDALVLATGGLERWQNAKARWEQIRAENRDPTPAEWEELFAEGSDLDARLDAADKRFNPS